MFRDANGVLDENLLAQYHDINRGYRRDVIPYTKNNAIKKYERGEISPSTLVESLKKDPFYHQAGRSHIPLKIRKIIESPLTKATALGTGIYEYLK